MSLSEDLFIDIGTAREMYQRDSSNPELFQRNTDELLHPRGSPDTLPDLRRAINQLQLGFSRYVVEEPERQSSHDLSNGSSLGKLKHMAWATELCSFVDYGLKRPQDEVLRVSNSIHILCKRLTPL